MVAAHLAVEGADQEPVQPQQADQEVAHRQLTVPCLCLLVDRGSAADNGRARRRVPRTTRRPPAAGRGRRPRSPAGGRRGAHGTGGGAGAGHDGGRRRCRRRDRRRTRPGRGSRPVVGAATCTTSGVATAAAARADHPPDVTTAGEPMRRGEHGRGSRAGVEPRGLRPPGSCGPCGDARTGCAPGAGAHAQPEAVHLVAAAVVRLVRTLAHELSPMVVRGGHAGGGQIARWRRTALVEASVDGSGFGRHRPPTRRWSGPGTSPGGAWTCGTRRHRVTEERYARRLRGVKSRPRAPAAAARRGCGYRPCGTAPPRGSAGPDSLWIASCSAPRGAGLCSTLVEFPRVRVGPASPRSPQSVGHGARSGPLTCGDPVSAGPP